MKKQTRRLSILVALAVLAALFAGCASQPAKQSGSMATGAPLAQETTEEAVKAADDGSLPIVDPGSAANYGKKIIYTVNMNLEAADAAKAVKDISAAAVEMGGYVSAMQYDKNTHTAWITVRIAPEKLSPFTERVGAMGKTLGQTMSSEDVTSSYTDLQSRLTNAQFQEQQLQEIMKKAEKVEDILKVRTELNNVQQEIEQLKGQIRLMDNQVGFSTVTISVQQPAVTVQKDETGAQFWGFAAIWQKIERGVSDSFNWTLNAIGAIFIAISYLIVPLIILAVIAVVIVWIIKAANKKKKKG